jgi:TolB-like protein/Flp pilus assembly protein TadD
MMYTFGDYELDVAQVELRGGGKAIALEPQVFALLCLLIENRERMVSRDEIIEKVWDGRVVTDSAVASRIKTARQAIGDDGFAQRLIRTVRGRGFRFVGDVEGRRARDEPVVAVEPARQDAADVAAETFPSVAVLPFQWLGSTTAHSIVADALPHELITALSRLRWIAVIARASSFRFRAPELDVREIGKTLNVGYCVCGLVEGRGDRLVVATELIDTRNGRVLWGERFSVEVAEIHEVRAQIVASVVAALEIHIPLNEAHLARLTPPESLDAWANYHLGLQAMYRFNKHDNVAAERHFRRAIDLDPEFARAHAGLSFTSFQDAFLSYSDNSAAATEQARRHAERSVELDPYDAFANFVMGRSYWLNGDIETSLNWLDRTIAFSPNFAQGLYSRAWADAVAGRGQEARMLVDKAMRLSPVDPLFYAMMGTRALSHIAQNEFDAAVPWAERAANAPGAHVLVGVLAVVAHGLAGDKPRAAFWAANVKRRRPDVSREHFFRSFPFADADMRAAVAAVLSTYGI